MTHLEIGRFLAKGFYTCAAVLDGFLYFIHDTVLLRKFFYDCKNLLSTRGSLVLHLPDICEVKESPRVKLISSLDTETTPALLTQILKHGDSKQIPVRTRVPVRIPCTDELFGYAKEAGFSSFECFSGWQKEPCPADCASLLVLR